MRSEDYQEDVVLNCPVCDGKLREIEKYGVTVDICPGCKGVWLDRGELDKILEMAAAGGPAGLREDAPPPPRYVEEPRRPAGDFDDDDDERDYREGRDRGRQVPQSGDYRRKKRSSWLGDIFESFGGD